MKNKTKEEVVLDVVEVEYLEDQDMYDFQVEDNNNFIANGVLVHNCVDEVDVIQDPRALEEAALIPSSYKGYFPLTCYLSTLKFSGGLMEKTLKKVKESGGEILRWNIVDVTERITPDVAKTDLPKVKRYISTQLPLSNISPEQWSVLTDDLKNKYECFEAYAGIAEHQLLPVMKNYLVDRPQTDTGGFFKTPQLTLNNFKKLSIEMADAQLLCNKPSSSGLVYRRFDNQANVLSPSDAYHRITTIEQEVNIDFLISYLKDLGVKFFGGADWGFTDLTSLVVLAIIPGGEVWLIDCFTAPGLELDDITKYARQFQDKYKIEQWYVDTAMSSYMKTFNRLGMPCPKFDKDVNAGISALQKQIVNSTNKRSFFVISNTNTEQVIEAFGKYRWKLDAKGDPTDKPDHGKDGTSDILDSIRYPMQNLFSPKGGIKVSFVGGDAKNTTSSATNTPNNTANTPKETHNNQMANKIKELASDDAGNIQGVKTGSVRFLW